MPDPVYEGRSTVVNTTSTEVTSGTVTFSSLSADDLVLAIVQRESYNGITGVTCGGNAMTQLMVTGTTLSQDFECGIWAIKAPSGGTNVDVVASFSTSDNWLSMVAFRWSNVNSATPLQSACNETGCDDLSGPATSQTLLSITTSQRALIVALGTDYDNYNTHTAQNSYTKRFDNAVAGGGSSSVQWAFDKVADSGTYGGAGETISTAPSDRWLGAILSFEPTGASGVTGTLSVTLGNVTASASGKVKATGSLASTLDNTTLGASGDVSTPQYARPASNISISSWTDQNSGPASYANIDEATPSDADFNRVHQTGIPGTWGLSVTSDPNKSTAHVVRYRLRGDGATDAIVRLKEGDTVRATWTETNVPATFTAYEHTLTGAQADAITNYGNLRIEAEAA